LDCTDKHFYFRSDMGVPQKACVRMIEAYHDLPR
jgi:hypothetical protein